MATITLMIIGLTSLARGRTPAGFRRAGDGGRSARDLASCDRCRGMRLPAFKVGLKVRAAFQSFPCCIQMSSLSSALKRPTRKAALSPM